MQYLAGITAPDPGMTQSVRTMVRQLLPTGAASLELAAAQFDLHSRTLHRRLAAENTTFGTLVDSVRREAAERYLRDTDISLSHLTRELGYAEQACSAAPVSAGSGAVPAPTAGRSAPPAPGTLIEAAATR